MNCGEKLIELAVSCPSCGTEVRQLPPASEITEATELPSPPEESQDMKYSFATQPASSPRRLSDLTKKLILVGMAAVVLVFLIIKFTGDGGGNHATPERAVKGFFNAVKQQDAEKMFSYLSTYVKDGEDNPEGLDRESAIKSLEEQFDERSPKLGSIDIKDVNIDGETAIVNYKVDFEQEGKKSTEEGTMNLIKVKGKWYVDINMP
ncbi:nuclear transport factor 2 family protein [Cohnella silvisoli]|uniref:DUF4878 domain-containing protein n=1 Tax=Cohnella silvisoli TaxID=2873699 RepID=A0ABV1KM64_9BACL|nr:nuclear transport factor 2 family protein [Cohnella silvisoli]MCD9020479.1 DUF4878 domain-containing protein [Cohnella silvisoli]